jgi:CubicO group peptidase (beta-lactamase class C family)
VFTAILLVELKNRGEVAMDDPIEKYLPESVKAPQRDGHSITLVHLSEQTSGLPRMPNNFRPKDAGNPFADYTAAQLYDYLTGYTLDRSIGEKFAYSNTGVGLLGHLLERATERSYEDLIVERISDVLGMSDTRITLTDDMKRRLADGYVGEDRSQNWDIPTLAGAGALRSSANDMIAFLSANLELSETPLHAAMEETHTPRIDTDIPDSRIGLGWITTSPDEGPSYTWHNGGTGGYRTFAGFCTATRTGVVVLTNSGSKSSDDIGMHLLNDSEPIQNAVPRTEVDVPETVLQTYAGKYRISNEFTLRVDLRGENLFAQMTRQPALEIFAESETDFFYKAVDAQITFERDGEGKVTGLVIHQGGANTRAERLAD